MPSAGSAPDAEGRAGRAAALLAPHCGPGFVLPNGWDAGDLQRRFGSSPG